MNEKQAEQKGYSSTGIYERNREKAKVRCDEIKKQGYKAVICDVPDSKLSRGPIGKGYSVYSEERYKIDRSLEDMKKSFERLPSEKKNMILKFKTEYQEIKTREIALKNKIEEYTKLSESLKK